jgi:hypothetical protein
MEGRAKKTPIVIVSVAPLGLERYIPWRGVRKLVWRHLTPDDREVARCAMNSRRSPLLSYSFADRCVYNDRLALLRWFHASVGRWRSSSVAQCAAEVGRLDVLQWLHATQCPMDYYTCSAAAEGGHLDVLQWLRAQECPWNSHVCARAVVGGHLDVLKWLRAAGCPWNRNTLDLARELGHEKIVFWAILNGCPQE